LVADNLIQNTHPRCQIQIGRCINRASDQVRQNYRLSQGLSKRMQYSNFTDDDIGDEGITELFNYLSDSGSDDDKRQSLAMKDSNRDDTNYRVFGSRVRQFEETSNDTGTFPIGKGSDENTLARESREKSLIKTFEGGDSNDEDKDVFREPLHFKDKKPEVKQEELKDYDQNDLILIDSGRYSHRKNKDKSNDDEKLLQKQTIETRDQSILDQYESRIK